jgi:hypothetical protein
MKLLIRSAMIFFGTLMTAALVALGEPASTGLAVDRDRDARQPSGHAMASTLAAAESAMVTMVTAPGR